VLFKNEPRQEETECSLTESYKACHGVSFSSENTTLWQCWFVRVMVLGKMILYFDSLQASCNFSEVIEWIRVYVIS